MEVKKGIMRKVAQLKTRDVVAIDGKALQRMAEKSAGKKAVHTVKAWCSSDKLVLDQVKTDEKSNEMSAVLNLRRL
jgi:hypothetical protein